MSYFPDAIAVAPHFPGWQDLADDELEARLLQRGALDAPELVADRDEPATAELIDELLA